MAEPKNTDPLSPETAFEDTSAALDKLLEEATKEDETQETETTSQADAGDETAQGEEEGEDEGAVSEEDGKTAEGEESSSEETTSEAAEGTPEADGAAPDPPATEDGEEGKEGEETASSSQAVAGEDSDFDKKIDSVQLPPHARPKSGEAFATVKTLAKEEVKKAQSELAEARKKIEELEPKVGQLDEETQKQLEELKAFKAATDIEGAPEVVKAKEAITTVESQVIDTLKQNGLNEEGLKHIESIGGIQNVDWKPIFEKLPEKTVDFIKYKLAEHQAKIADQQTLVNGLKSKAGEFIKAREEQAAATAKQAESTRQEAAESILRELPFAQLQEIPKDAKPEDQKAIEQSNKIAEEIRKRVEYGLSDTSPEMHGTLAVSAALAFRYNAQNKAWAKAYADLEKQHKSVTAELERIRNARKGKRTSTPTAPKPATEKGGKFQIGVRTEDALDAHLAEINASQD